MQFLREDQGAATKAIAQRICDELFAGHRVLWLVSGGSNVQIEVDVMRLLHDHAADKLGGLAILPLDERYGSPGHANGNTEALRKAGFDPGAATWVDVLTHDVPFNQTIDFYSEVAATALKNAAIVIGQFGIGADGHTAGILPGSPAVESTDELVTGYEWGYFARMTLTQKALKSVNVAYALAYGDDKKEALERLQKNAEPLSKLPAKLLYEIPEVYVYNDAMSSEGS